MENAILGFVYFITASLSWAESAEKPNIVIFYADDMGVADVSYGDSEAKIQTPHIDRLARRGMTFTDGHSSSGICTPSRFALLTGQHHWRRFHGIVGGFGKSVFQPDDFTLPRCSKSKVAAPGALENGISAGTGTLFANPASPKSNKFCFHSCQATVPFFVLW